MTSPFTDEDGHFKDPDMAAMHAVLVQGGFTTPKREAARMLTDGGVAEQRALDWMTAKGLTETDLEWDSGTRWRRDEQIARRAAEEQGGVR